MEHFQKINTEYKQAFHSRRNFFKMLFLSAVGSVMAFLPVIRIRSSYAESRYRNYLRPPGALEENEFRSTCIGCYRCVTACPNQCIEMAGLDSGWRNLFTPVIQPRSRGCTLCMRCTEVCPTGALRQISRDMSVIEDTVKMGTAFVNEELCFSYAGRTCGVCYRACPLPGKALTVGLYEEPTVHPDKCVGCGLCEQACIHLPQAIRVRSA